MSTSRLETTTHAIKGGLASLTVEKATKNIEGWEESLAKSDHAGVKTVVADLGKLKKLLHATPIDDSAVKTLMAKLGKDTVTVAGKDETASSKHIRDLGEALSHAS